MRCVWFLRKQKCDSLGPCWPNPNFRKVFLDSSRKGNSQNCIDAKACSRCQCGVRVCVFDREQTIKVKVTKPAVTLDLPRTIPKVG